MSRSGRIQIAIPENTEVKIENGIFHAKGRLTVNRAPKIVPVLSWRLLAKICPLWALTICCEILRPSPE